MKIIYTIIIVLLMMFMITFSQENTSVVQLKYYDFMKQSLPIYMLIFLSFLAGVIFTGFMGIVERFRMNRTISKLNKAVRDLRRQIRENEPPPLIEDGKDDKPANKE
jgi:uncharacterized integral membrane protein